jgi:hypothetical protein
MSNTERQAAQDRLKALSSLIATQSKHEHLTNLADEIEALDRAIGAFHLEGIRFRIYNVDRMVTHSPVALPAEAAAIVADVRRHLEAAGFHTRSHQAPA